MAVEPESYLNVESSLTSILETNWKKKGDAILKRIVKGMREDDEDAIEKAIQDIKLEKAMVGVKKAIKFQGAQAFYFGVSRLTPPAESQSQKDKAATPWVAAAVAQMELILKDSNRGVRRRIRNMINAELARQKAEVQKAEIIREFVSGVGEVMQTGAGSAALAASLQTSRLASMGYLMEATAMGQKTYIINAVLDVRTCPVCTYMDQQVYSVETLWSRMTQAIEATEIADLKRLNPWPSQTKQGLENLYQMTSQEIVNSGFDAPPYHPLCRCYLDFTETPVEEIEVVTSPFELPGTIVRERIADEVLVPGITSDLIIDETDER